VPDPSARTTETRYQLKAGARFLRAEGMRLHGRTLYISTTADSTLLAYDLATGRLEPVYEAASFPHDPPVILPDQLTSSPAGEIFIAEDSGKPELALGVLDPPGEVTRFLTAGGREHRDSELTGLAFTPDARRLYFASQRAFGDGALYEVTGPFRRRL
jgi:sugar lactone lactonase YvrE